MILRLLVALTAFAQDTSLVSQGKYHEANQAFERMALREYVNPGLTPARVLEILRQRFPADREFLSREMPKKTMRFRAIERLGDKLQITLPSGALVAVTFAPHAVRVDGKPVRLTNAPEFFADLQTALGRKVATKFDWLMPARAEAVAPIPLLVGAAIFGGIAWYQDHQEKKKTPTEAYLSSLVNDCREERENQTVAFETSRTAERFRTAIDNNVIPASLTKIDCRTYAKQITKTVSTAQLREGDPQKTCDQLHAYMDCLEVFKSRGQPMEREGSVRKASDSSH